MRLIDADALIERIKYSSHEYERVRIDAVTGCLLTDFVSPTIDPIHVTGSCYCKECTYYEPIRNYPDCSKILPCGYCYYWNYEEGESPNEVEENDFCSRGVPKNDKTN